MSKKSTRGASAWRSLGEKRDPVGTAKAAATKKPVQIGEKTVTAKSLVGRRDFFVATGATAAMLGASGCLRRPEERILPYTRAPEYAQPGNMLHFASTAPAYGDALGVLVESCEGRPTKIDGNPQHEGSRGATDASTQAMILDLYDPDRSAHVSRKQGDSRENASWADFDAWWREHRGSLGTGGGLRFLLPPTASPSMRRARSKLAENFPEAHVHTWSPINESELHRGAEIAFGSKGNVLVAYDRARVIVSLDCDFLATEPGHVRSEKQFARGRTVNSPQDTMNRLYAVEGTLSVTGMNADHRLRLESGRIEAYLKALGAQLASLPDSRVPASLRGVLGEASLEGVDAAWLEKVAADLHANRDRSAIVVGQRQPARVHALAHLLNYVLGNVGRTVAVYPVADEREEDSQASIEALVEAMSQNQVDTLVILGGNPVYDAPADLDFQAALGNVENSVHLANFVDETSQACAWHLPEAHWLESWSDHTNRVGQVSIQQPLIAPLRGGRNALEVFAMMAGVRAWRGHNMVRRTLRQTLGPAAPAPVFERVWRRSLHGGIVPRTGGRGRAPDVNVDAVVAAISDAPSTPLTGDWEVVFAPSYQVWDGRQSNNEWMLECPDPVSKTVWGNAAWISHASADAMDVSTGDLLQVTVGEATIEIPAYVLPGHGDNVATLALGFGRSQLRSQFSEAERGNRRFEENGSDVYPLRTLAGLGFARASVSKVNGTRSVVTTQEHHSMRTAVDVPVVGEVEFAHGPENSPSRPLAVSATLDEYRERPNFGQWAEPTPEVTALWTSVDYSAPRDPAHGGQSFHLIPNERPPAPDAGPRYKWGMVVDLTKCTGCNACIVACHAENNIATVGPEQVALGREMHWLRLDRYFVGEDIHDPQVSFQPVGCQHCENAPCENVCPVAATVHSPEGLNDMAYNRCIGTRYCMNNCPYKVRRFNFLDYHGRVPELRAMQFNPNVTVRMRGVMEKCSFCVQRIQAARILAKREGRRIRGNEVHCACAQVCPSEAIYFGDLNSEDAITPAGQTLNDLANLDRHYHLLASVGARPRVIYLGQIRNPNPEMG